MTQRPLTLFIVSFAMTALLPLRSNAAPRLGDPCKHIRSDFDARIKALKQEQQSELEQCRKAGASGCSELKSRQKQQVSQLENERGAQLAGCRNAPRARGIASSNTVDCYNAKQDYVEKYYRRPGGDNDNYKHPPSAAGGGGGDKYGHKPDADGPPVKLPHDDSKDAGSHFSHHDTQSSPSASSSGHDTGSHGSSSSSAGSSNSGGGSVSHASSGSGSSNSGSSSSSSSSSASHDAPFHPK